MIINRAVRWLSGEWQLDNRPNGGTVILLRSLWISALVYTALIGIKLLFGGAICSPDFLNRAKCAAASGFFHIAVPAFAFAYTALYVRFASQWSYLANLYNLIMAAKVRGDGAAVSAESEGSSKSVEAMQKWQAGFIEDAEELHLATKPMFAGVILSMLAVVGVRERFIEGTAGGEHRLKILEARVRLAYESASRRH